jgi:CBS domain-containing protein
MVTGPARPQLRPETIPPEGAMLRLRDIMTTDVVSLSPTTTLREAAELLSARHIGGAPVVDGGVVVGVVSASDILAFVASTPEAPRGRGEPEADADWDDRADREGDDDPSARYFSERWDDDAADVVERFAEGTEGTHEWGALDDHTVAEVMTRNLVALAPTAPVTAAAERIHSADVHRVLVMECGALLGLVTTTDIARAVARGRVARRTYVFDTSRDDRGYDGGTF